MAAQTRSDRIDRAIEEQREEYGGFKFGAVFFGWLVASGLSSLLTTLLAAAGGAIALTKLESAAQGAVDSVHVATVGIVSGILLLAVTGLSYLAGGYVAGRMARFDGLRQGIGVWLMTIVIAIVLALAGAIFGAQFNLLQQLNLPHIPIDEGKFTLGGVITLIILMAVALGTAIAGGKMGEAYHRKIDHARD